MSAALYQTVYLIVVTVLTAFLSVRYIKRVDDFAVRVSTKTNMIGYVIAIAVSLFIGFRPLSGRYFVDMSNYNLFYYVLSYGHEFEFSWDKQNYLFDNLFDWLGANYYDITVFFVIISLIYFIVSYKAISRLIPTNPIYAFVVFLGAFSTFSYATNGIKAGAAAALFLCAIAYRDRKWIAAFLLFASIGFHHSMIMPVIAYIAAFFYKNTKVYLGFWIICLIIAAAHITFFQELFAGVSNDETAQHYLTNTNEEWGGKTGFRWDFVLYSLLPICVGYYTVFMMKVKSLQYNFILNTYLLTNAIWLLCMYVPFNNRIAYLSWCLYPILLVYPFFSCRTLRYKVGILTSVVWIQLAFSLAMYFLVY